MSNREPLVSVVMATYGGDRVDFLRLAVESILQQTYPAIELIVAIDGPVEEETQSYLDLLQERHGNVRLLRLPENRGAAHARNEAIRDAHGEYVAVIDADDSCPPERIERQLAHLRESGADVASTFMIYTDDAGNELGRKDMFVTNAELRRTALFLNPINNACVFGKTSVFRDFPYDERFRRGHDYHLWARLMVADKKLANLPEYLCFFRTGGDFLARRSRAYFVVEIRAKLLLVRIYPWYARPFALAVALTMPFLRLLPAWCLRLVYRVRNSVRAR